MTAKVPKEVLLDVLGFLPRLDLNDDMFVCEKWHLLIKGAGAKLPQRQEVSMRVDGPLSLELSNGRKTIQVMEGNDNSDSVLKDCLVRDQRVIWDGLEAFEEHFGQLVLLVGQKIPFKRLDCTFPRESQLEALALFKDNYSSMIYLTISLKYYF